MGRLPPLSRRSISLPALKCGLVFSPTATVSRVCGLRPMRALRCLTVKVPNPRSFRRSSDVAPQMSIFDGVKHFRAPEAGPSQFSARRQD